MVKQRVVYVLGAGFSQPYGLPVMSTFMERARDIYESDPEKYSELGSVIKALNLINSNTLRIDVPNIEEVLSVLEMASLVKDSHGMPGLSARRMKDFIRTVITESTKGVPTEEISDNLSDGLARHIFNDRGGVFSTYGFFAASLFGLSVPLSAERDNYGIPTRISNLRFERSSESEYEYSIVTTNYDRVLQKFEDFINVRQKDPSTRVEFVETYTHEPKPTGGRVVPLLKLHGTVERDPHIIPSNDITAMTWSKNLYQKRTAQVLREAYKAIRSAHFIRIIGYSMPDTDSYLKFLLKASMLNHPNLKTIDVLTLDDDRETTKRRYQALVGEKTIRWRADNVSDYLQQIFRMTGDNLRNDALTFNWLEEAHRYFFEHADILKR